MKYRAIIFDMDGTIVHTEHIWKKATIELLQSHGITLTQKDIDELKHHLSGIGLTQGCTYIKEKFGMQAPLCDIIEQKAARAHALYAQEICFITGFIEFHQLVKKQNIATGLATNAHPDTVTLTNTKLNLQQFFGNHMYNISHVNNVGKPNPDIYLYAARRMGFKPEECIAIEDSAHGIKAAQAAGMLCIGINTHGNPLQVEKADIIVKKYEEIMLNSLIF